jgi:Fe-S cluster biogenesis protein NfuA
MFIQTEATPNPATLKFLPGMPVSPTGIVEFRSADDAAGAPVARALLQIDGVSSVMFGDDFVAVTKAQGEWQHLKPFILGVLMERLSSGEPLLTESTPSAGDEFFDAQDADTVAAIKELIESRVRPNVLSDGGDIAFRGFRDGIVYVGMKGACSGCPSSTATLKHGIENLLRHYVPEVTGVEQV